jgi:hypothetical protein
MSVTPLHSTISRTSAKTRITARWASAATVVALTLVALVPTAAFAKGPTDATLTGPGIDGSIKLGVAPWELGDGLPEAVEGDNGTATEIARGDLMALADDTRLWSALDSTGGAVASAPPTDDLGPRYGLTWTLIGPTPDGNEIVQDIYPYADGGAVTYIEPGTPYWGTEQFQGGWEVASPRLYETLVAAGLPSEPATAGWALPQLLIACGILVVLGLLFIGVLRFRSAPKVVAATG